MLPSAEWIKRVNYFSPVLSSEYDIFRDAQPDFRARYMPWNYGILEDMVAKFPEGTAPGNRVLFGNSATPSNNHLDVIDELSTFLDRGYDILCPLSYGNSDYGDLVEKAGVKRYGSRFVALRSYMALDSYTELIGGCGVAVMNQVRQQGMGNVVSMLYRGARVYLHPFSPVGRHFRNLGCTLFETTDITSDMELGVLPAAAIEATRDALRFNYGYEAACRKSLDVLNRIGARESQDHYLYGRDELVSPAGSR